MFRRTKTPTACLVVGNAGDAAGLPAATLLQRLQPAGAVAAHPHANPSTPVVFVEFADTQQAIDAKQHIEHGATDVVPATASIGFAVRCEEPASRVQPDTVRKVHPSTSMHSHAQPTPVHCTAEALAIPGLALLLEYVSPAEEAALLACIDAQPWERAAARRVQHFGHRFSYVVGIWRIHSNTH